MSDNPYIEKLRAMKPHFGEMNIKRLRVFGSQARGDARPGSDVDLLVDLEAPMGLIGFAGIKRQLEEYLHARVDLVTPGGLHKDLRSRILDEARDV